MSFPKKGKLFPNSSEHLYKADALNFATVISMALRRAAADRNTTIKTVVNWTGANERTVKNWFNGCCGPSGDHLMTLANQCDEVMDAIIMMTGRRWMLMSVDLVAAEKNLVRALTLVREIQRDSLRD